MKRHLILPLISCAIICTSCIGTRYTNTDAPATLQYLYESNEKTISGLSKSYKSTLDDMLENGDPKPGLCADYAVILAKQNKHEEANKWLNREATIYPSASTYVYFLKKQLVPEFADDTSALKFLDPNVANQPTNNTVSIDSLTIAPRSEMSFMEKRKAAWERRKQEKAIAKEEKKLNANQAKANEEEMEAVAKDKKNAKVKDKKQKATEEKVKKENAPKEKATKEKVKKEKATKEKVNAPKEKATKEKVKKENTPKEKSVKEKKNK